MLVAACTRSGMPPLFPPCIGGLCADGSCAATRRHMSRPARHDLQTIKLRWHYMPEGAWGNPRARPQNRGRGGEAPRKCVSITHAEAEMTSIAKRRGGEAPPRLAVRGG